MKVGEHEVGVHHAIVLLDLHDDVGSSTAQTHQLEFLVAGALVAELLHRGRVKFQDGAVSLRAGRPASRVLAPVEETIGGRPTPLLDVLHTIAEGGHRHAVHSDLVGRGVLEVKRRRKWLVFRESTWPTADPTLERALIVHLRQVAAEPPGEFCPEDSVFALVQAGGLEKAVFDGPVDLDVRIRRCPVGAVLRQLFADRTHRMDLN